MPFRGGWAGDGRNGAGGDTGILEGDPIKEKANNPLRLIRDAVLGVKGNARALIIAEPLFAIPYTMISAFLTLYMLELGATKAQVGIITSFGLAIHLVLAVVSAYVTDRFGRRYTTLVFDSLGWCGSLFIYAISQNVYYFFAAAVANALTRIVMNSFHCLMLEDSPPENRIHIFSFMNVATILAGFCTPLGAMLIKKMSLVPAMRMMCMFTAFWMLALFIVRNMFLTETDTGRQKIAETKGVSLLGVCKSYLPVFKRMFGNKLFVITLIVRTLSNIQFTIRSTFLAVLVTERLGFPAESMSVFYTFNSIIMLIALLFITPILAQFTRRWPISLGIWCHLSATVVLLLSPPTQNIGLLITAAILIALGVSISGPRIDSLVANIISNEDRSVVNAATGVILLLLTTPSGFIGGVLAEIDIRLPFVLNLALFLINLLTLHIADRMERVRPLT